MHVYLFQYIFILLLICIMKSYIYFIIFIFSCKYAYNIIFFDIRDVIGGPWIKSAKHITFHKNLYILCADLRVWLQIYRDLDGFCKNINGKKVCGSIHTKFHYNRDCIILDNITNLDNHNGKFVPYYNQKIYKNRIITVVGLDKSLVEYFPSNTLCYMVKDFTTGDYCCYWIASYTEHCIDYENYSYVVFHKNKLHLLDFFQYVECNKNLLIGWCI